MADIRHFEFEYLISILLLSLTCVKPKMSFIAMFFDENIIYMIQGIPNMWMLIFYV